MNSKQSLFDHTAKAFGMDSNTNGDSGSRDQSSRGQTSSADTAQTGSGETDSRATGGRPDSGIASNKVGEGTERQGVDAMGYSQQMSLQATTPPANVPGYRLTRFLGAGAFGQVWVGRDLNTGRDVAVKFYLHRGGVNWSLLSREVKNLVQLSADRYVVQVLEVGWDAEPPYYVMELIPGGSLEEKLQARSRLPVEDAVGLFEKICLGLNRCHAKGVLHCDLKPANLLLDDNGEPRLADFGQSRLSGDQTPALGTLFYMAPEQADLHASPDASWDVYALGAIVYRMLTGRPPHREQSTLDHLDTANSLEERLTSYRQMIMDRGAPRLLTERDGVDRPLAKIVARCLAPNPQDRYANVQQILQELSRRQAFRTRRPLLLMGIVGPLLILIATSVFAARTVRQASKSTETALRQEAFGSNELAAAFAAKTLESEIDRYYRLTQDEADDVFFRDSLRRCISDPLISAALGEINEMGTASSTHQSGQPRERLLASESHLQLKSLLTERLSEYGPQSGQHFASMFVTDPSGTIIAIAYDSPVEISQDSSGRNYCYRTYFHGGRRDLDKDSTQIGSVMPLQETRMSAAFSSTATQLWKVAFSTPIYLGQDRSKPDALFVVTVNLGDFDLPQSRYGINQVAVLVEARPGPTQGTILQHPMIESRRRLGADVAGDRYQISADLMERLFEGRDVDYLDPLSEADGGTPYEGQWIAAMQPVSLPDRPVRSPSQIRSSAAKELSSKDQPLDEPESDLIAMTSGVDEEKAVLITEEQADGKTDLLVLVQYRLKTITSPVQAMRSALLWEGTFAVVSIVFVTLGLWLVVRRFGLTPSVDETITDLPEIPAKTLKNS